jgi:signal transduction histidine kinase
MQIRERLTIQFILVTALILFAALFFVWFQFGIRTEESFYQDLKVRAELTAKTALYDKKKLLPQSEYNPEIGEEDGFHHLDTLYYRENIVIYNAAHQRVFTLNPNSKPVPSQVLVNMQGAGEQRFHHGAYHALGLHMKDSVNQEYLVVAEALFDDHGLHDLGNLLIITFLLGMFLCALAGWFFAGRAVAPMARIVEQVEMIKPDDLSSRLQSNHSHDELGRLSAAFNRMLDRVQAAFVAQRSFISNVSHELRNPLAAMIAQSDVMLAKDRSEREYKQALVSNLQYAHRLADASEKLLTLAKLESGSVVLKFMTLKLDDLVLRAVSVFQRQHPEYHTIFDIENFPDDPEHMNIRGNDALLQMALMNLMDNACKFSPDQSVEVSIRFGKPGERHYVYIKDNGPGIAEEEQARIFEPFFRSKNGTNVKGSGVGLSLVKRIMDAHQADIQLVSESGKGATFIIGLMSA